MSLLVFGCLCILVGIVGGIAVARLSHSHRQYRLGRWH